MSEAPDSNSVETPISNRRIIWLMGVVVVLGSLAGLIFVSPLWSLGFFIGGVLSFGNFFWLKSSLKRMFVETTDGEFKPHYSAVRYVLRYFTLGAILGIIFLTHILPALAVVLGLVSLAFAVLIEAFIRIFSHFFKRKEI